jgi:hypothetical protein
MDHSLTVASLEMPYIPTRGITHHLKYYKLPVLRNDTRAEGGNMNVFVMITKTDCVMYSTNFEVEPYKEDIHY